MGAFIVANKQDKVMAKFTQICILGIGVSTLVGCTSTPQAPTPEHIIPFEKTLDTVHTREDSVWEYVESRAGAAVRNQEMSHVLFNEHHAADPNQLISVETHRKPVMAKTEAPKEGSKSRDETKKGDAPRVVKKDQSIYRSQNTDKSIYAKQKAQN